jgi:hypothetical protein
MTAVYSLASMATDYTGAWVDLPYIGRDIQKQVTIQGHWSGYDSTNGLITIQGTVDKSNASLYDTIETFSMATTTGRFTLAMEPYGIRAYRMLYTQNSGTVVNMSVYDTRISP